MTILNISILTFLIGLSLFSYTIYERSLVFSSEEQKNEAVEEQNYEEASQLKKILDRLQNGFTNI